MFPLHQRYATKVAPRKLIYTQMWSLLVDVAASHHITSIHLLLEINMSIASA